MERYAWHNTWFWLGTVALLLVLLLSLHPLPAQARHVSHASSSMTALSPFRSGLTPVRASLATSRPVVPVSAPNTLVAIYVGAFAPSSPATHPSPTASGKVIVVSLSRQWMDVYQDGVEVYSAAVMTGRPSLPTPTGTYHIFAKQSPDTFYSPWPLDSPNWYAPTTVSYALEWGSGGYFLHDSWWHSVYGPGTNLWHNDPVYGWQWGTHGCVAMPLSVAAWLYQWAPIGTTVQIHS